MPVFRSFKPLLAAVEFVAKHVKFAHTARVGCWLQRDNMPANAATRRTQGLHSVSQTPSAQVVWLRRVEGQVLLALLGLSTLLWFGLLGDRQRLGLGVLFAYRLVDHFTYTHRGFLVVWGDAKSPA